MLYRMPSSGGDDTSVQFPPAFLTDDVWFSHAASLLMKALDGQPLFPCHFAINALHKKTLVFSDIPDPLSLGSSSLLDDLRQFLSFYRLLPYRSALITFVDTRGSRSLADDESTFWKILRYLHTHSRGSVRYDYDAHDWHFNFDDEELYFNGHSPHYLNRLSRRSGECLAIVIQTRFNLKHVTGDTPSALAVSEQIRHVVDQYDRIPRSPYLGPHFDWRQFWLLDTNDVDERSFPLQLSI